MKKGIEACPDYDRNGTWLLKVRKQKGKFTLDEIVDVMREWEPDIYMMQVRALDEEGAQYGEDSPGDYVEVYRAESFELKRR